VWRWRAGVGALNPALGGERKGRENGGERREDVRAAMGKMGASGG
jgi:hypothetical protein